MARFKPITRDAFERGRQRPSTPRASSVSYDRDHDHVLIQLDTGLCLSFRSGDAFGLAQANADELSEVEIVGTGNAIHFPRLDTYLSIPKLLEGFLGPLDWSRREMRAAASRENGKLGGRPRKVAERA